MQAASHRIGGASECGKGGLTQECQSLFGAQTLTGDRFLQDLVDVHGTTTSEGWGTQPAGAKPSRTAKS